MKIFGVELRFNGFRIYHEGDKPTPSEIGAAASNHTHTTMGAASASVAGKAGLVPAPPAGKQGQFLRGDATWAVPYTHPTTSGNKHIPSGGAAGQVLGYAAAGTAAWKTLNASDVGAAPSSHTHDDRYYTETDVKNLIDATFLTKTFTGAKVSIAGKTAKAITITCATPSGYTAIGVIGYYTGSTYILPCRVAKGRMDVYNTDSNTISVTPTITMLYAKSGAV